MCDETVETVECIRLAFVFHGYADLLPFLTIFNLPQVWELLPLVTSRSPVMASPHPRPLPQGLPSSVPNPRPVASIPPPRSMSPNSRPVAAIPPRPVAAIPPRPVAAIPPRQPIPVHSLPPRQPMPVNSLPPIQALPLTPIPPRQSLPGMRPQQPLPARPPMPQNAFQPGARPMPRPTAPHSGYLARPAPPFPSFTNDSNAFPRG